MKLNAQIEFRKRVSFQDKLLFTKHLSTMVKAGIPIVDAFETLIEQSKSMYFKKVLTGIMSDLENGKTLARSLGKYPKVFDTFYISLIEIGETSGTLNENIEFLTKQLAKDYALRKKVKSAMLYPAIVLTTTIIMGSFISLFILPRLVGFFDSFEIDLPLSTKMLVWFSVFMKNYGAAFFLIIIFLIVVLRFVVRSNSVKPKWHTILLKLPIFGRMISYTQLSRFTRNLGTLIKSGVPITKSLEVTSQTLSNVRFRNDLEEISGLLSKGKSIGETMKKDKYDIFPPLVWRMIIIGEKTGKLDETLLYLGDFYDDEVDDISRNLSTILEPILLIFIGLVVGFVALSIISPIYQLTGSVRR
jgi:type IV pilus assembly protein PilC